MLDFDLEKNISGVSVKMKSEKLVHAHKKGAPKTKGYIFKRPHSSQPLTRHQGKKKSSLPPPPLLPMANSVNKTNPMTNQ